MFAEIICELTNCVFSIPSLAGITTLFVVGGAFIFYKKKQAKTNSTSPENAQSSQFNLQPIKPKKTSEEKLKDVERELGDIYEIVRRNLELIAGTSEEQKSRQQKIEWLVKQSIKLNGGNIDPTSPAYTFSSNKM